MKQDNPVAAALLSNMGFKEMERVEVKKEFLRMLARLELDPARMSLIIGFFESYLPWKEEDERRLAAELHELQNGEEERIMELKTYWERKAEERADARAEERIKELVGKFLHAQFGEAAQGLQAELAKVTDAAALDRIAASLFQARSLEEAAAIIAQNMQA